MIALADLLMERFKVRTRAVENPTGETAAEDTAKVILGNNPNRLAFVIVNLGDTPTWVALSNQVAAETYGIRLDGNGGSFSCIWDEDFQMTAWAWWIIAEAAEEPAIYVIEVISY